MADKVKDPVCGMMIRPEDAAATELGARHAHGAPPTAQGNVPTGARGAASSSR